MGYPRILARTCKSTLQIMTPALGDNIQRLVCSFIDFDENGLLLAMRLRMGLPTMASDDTIKRHFQIKSESLVEAFPDLPSRPRFVFVQQPDRSLPRKYMNTLDMSWRQKYGLVCEIEAGLRDPIGRPALVGFGFGDGGFYLSETDVWSGEPALEFNSYRNYEENLKCRKKARLE